MYTCILLIKIILCTIMIRTIIMRCINQALPAATPPYHALWAEWFKRASYGPDYDACMCLCYISLFSRRGRIILKCRDWTQFSVSTSLLKISVCGWLWRKHSSFVTSVILVISLCWRHTLSPLHSRTSLRDWPCLVTAFQWLFRSPHHSDCMVH